MKKIHTSTTNENPENDKHRHLKKYTKKVTQLFTNLVKKIHITEEKNFVVLKKKCSFCALFSYHFNLENELLLFDRSFHFSL